MFKFRQEISKEIFFRKYALHGEKSVEEVLRGVAEEVASVEPLETNLKEILELNIKPPEFWANKFYNAMITGELIGGGRILANARLFSMMKNYNNCFTIDIEDDMESIYLALKEDALIGKVGGGVGFNASKLRPKWAFISKGGESSGVMSFVEVFDASAKAIHTGGGRRCLPKGTEVHVRQGPKNIEDVLVGDEVLTSDGYEKVSSLFVQGEQKTIIIHTPNGDFECTPNHKMAVFDGCFSYIWKEAKDLSSGDKLVFVGTPISGTNTLLPPFKHKKPKGSTTSVDIKIPQLDADIAWLFGLIFGDGYVWINKSKSKGGVSVSCDNKYPEIIAKAKEQLERFGANVFLKDGDGDCTNIISYSNQLGIYFSNFKEPNKSLTIPNFITRGTVEVRSGFIAGLFDADGSCKTRPIKVVSTVYEDFSVEVKKLLNTLGIPSSAYAHDRSKNGWQTLHTIFLSNAVAVRKWDEIIGIYSGKYCSARKTKSFYQSGVYDFGWSKEDFLNENIKINRKIWSKNSNNIKLTTLERLIDKKINLYPVDFLGISDGRVVETFDIEVENKHEFVAEGFLTHNSAHILILNVDHPDIEEFITYKRGGENNKLTQFNISVGITDEFIEAVLADKDWNLIFPLMKKEEKPSDEFLIWKKPAFDLEYAKKMDYTINEKGEVLMRIYKAVKARELYDTMTKHAWWYNEPGALFLDTIEKENNAPHHFKIDRANPCGEIVMPSYSLCCLSSINYSKLVRNPFTEEAYFDFDRLEELVKIGVRFLDNVLDATDYPLPKIEEISKRWRRIGLGPTGIGDAFMKLRMVYGSEESVAFSEKLSNFVAEVAYNYSVDLAIEKGSFPGFDEGIGDYGFIKKLKPETQARIKKHGLRNIGLLTSAPTGTTSLTLGNNCSSGIEPIFSLQYDRTIKQDDGTTKTETVYDDGWLDFVEHSGYKEGYELPDFVITSHEVSIKGGIDVQAAFQKWIDHSISRTVNIPFGTPLEEYKDIFLYAWEKGLKGVTSFHEGAAMEGVLTTKKKEDDVWKTIEVLKNSTKRPNELPCDIYEIQVNKEPVVVLIGLNPEEPYNGLPYEVFYTDNSEGLINLNRAKEGKIVKITDSKTKPSRYDLVIEGKRSKFVLEDLAETFNDDYATMCRLLSLSMRHQIPIEFIMTQMNKVRRFGTFQKAIARVLKKYIPDGEMLSGGTSSKCPECEGDMRFESGCTVCASCGYSTCG